MPNLIGSIPDKRVAPLVDYLDRARAAGLGPDRIDYNDLLMVLLIVGLGLDI